MDQSQTSNPLTPQLLKRFVPMKQTRLDVFWPSSKVLVNSFYLIFGQTQTSCYFYFQSLC